MQRRQPPAGAANPITQGGAIQRDALASEDLRLSIQWQVVAVFVDQDMRQQRFGGHTAVDRAVRCRRLHDRLPTGAARVARSVRHSDAEVCRQVIQHLGAVVADQMQ